MVGGPTEGDNGGGKTIDGASGGRRLDLHRRMAELEIDVDRSDGGVGWW